jgi:dihydrolipoamide dehydrogenase
LNHGVGFLLKKNKVDVIWGEAAITKSGEVLVVHLEKAGDAAANPIPKGVLGAGTYLAKTIIVATGARPHVIPGLESDGKLIWTYFEAMVRKIS